MYNLNYSHKKGAKISKFAFLANPKAVNITTGIVEQIHQGMLGFTIGKVNSGIAFTNFATVPSGEKYSADFEIMLDNLTSNIIPDNLPTVPPTLPPTPTEYPAIYYTKY